MKFVRGFLVTCLTLFGIAQAQQPQVDSVASVVRVTGREANGRIERFADARGRPFEVTYDRDGKVSSVRSPGRRNRADLIGTQYTADGKIVSAMLGDGNVLVFSYDVDGTQYVQDRGGALIRRAPTSEGYITTSERDPSGKLRLTLERMDALLKALTDKGPH